MFNMGDAMLRVVVLLLVLSTHVAFAGDTVLGGACDLAVIGASDKHAFLVFDKELRMALSRQDVAAMALLVRFPVRVNHADGSKISLNNAAALQTRFAEVFPPSVRSAVLNQKPEEIFCKYTGIMYGNGAVWIEAVEGAVTPRYRVTAINLPAVDTQTAAHKTSTLEYVCDAEKHRVVIDSDASGKVRYRAWNKPRFLTDHPDMEATAGTKSLEGTDACTQAIWSFRKGNTEFVVRELGCTDGAEPAGTTGELAVLVDGRPQQRWWCW
jgi:hypothetical protein